MRKIKNLALTLTLGLLSSLATAAGVPSLIVSPIEQAARQLSRGSDLSIDQARHFLKMLREGHNLISGSALVRSEADVLKILDLPGNESVKAIVARHANKTMDSFTQADLRELMDAMADRVQNINPSRVCSVCSARQDNPLASLGLRSLIRVEGDNLGLDVLRGYPNDVGALMGRIQTLNRRGLVKNASQKQIIDLMREADAMKRVDIEDLKKTVYALEALDGRFGPEAKEAAEVFIAMADGNILTEKRIALAIADFADDGADGKAALKDLTAIGKEVNAENSGVAARRSALCQKFAAKAKTSASGRANFNQLKKCPNYASIFNACTL